MPLADAFVSKDDLVKLITENVQPSRDLGGVDVKSIDVVKLGQLYALMSERTFAEVLPEFLPEVHSVSEDGPWIYRCPAALQSMLASLTEATLTLTAGRWAQIPEFGLDAIDSRVVTSILESLSGLARRAESTNSHLYLWNSL